MAVSTASFSALNFSKFAKREMVGKFALKENTEKEDVNGNGSFDPGDDNCPFDSNSSQLNTDGDVYNELDPMTGLRLAPARPRWEQCQCRDLRDSSPV